MDQASPDERLADQGRTEASGEGPPSKERRMPPPTTAPASDPPAQRAHGNKARCQKDSPNRGMFRGISSLSELLDAYKSKDSQWRIDAQKEFEAVNGELVETYFTPHLRAAAVLVKVGAAPRVERRRLLVRFDGRDVASMEPLFEEAF